MCCCWVLAGSNNCGTRTVSAALQQSGGVSGTLAATSSSIVGFVRESVGEGSAALPSRDWRSGGTAHSGGYDNWSSGGEWSSGGWHQAVSDDTSASVVGVETE